MPRVAEGQPEKNVPCKSQIFYHHHQHNMEPTVSTLGHDYEKTYCNSNSQYLPRAIHALDCQLLTDSNSTSNIPAR